MSEIIRRGEFGERLPEPFLCFPAKICRVGNMRNRAVMLEDEGVVVLHKILRPASSHMHGMAIKADDHMIVIHTTKRKENNHGEEKGI